MVVVPGRVAAKLAEHLTKSHRNEHLPTTLLFHRADEPFDDSETGRLAEESESSTYVPLPAPVFVRPAGELSSLVGHDAPRRESLLTDRLTEERLDLSRGRHLREDREPGERPGCLIDYHRHPPAEGPALRQREREPRHPKTRERGSDTQIHMPHVSGSSRDGPPPRTVGGERFVRGGRCRLERDPSDRRGRRPSSCRFDLVATRPSSCRFDLVATRTAYRRSSGDNRPPWVV
jgi:hypothetical protein